jgi:hypothetical protein
MTETLIDSTYEPCAQCGAPLDDTQRYCVFCGASRHHAADPVARYLAVARQRPVAAAPPPAVVAAPPRSDRWLVLALALLPVAAAAGVLVGRSGGENGDLVAALRAQKAPVVQIGGGAAAAGTGTTRTASAGGGGGGAGASVARTFPLKSGFTVELRTLSSGASGTAIAAAASAAQGKGAKAVGVLDPTGFTVKPDPGTKLVLFSGAYHSRAEATKALGRLKHGFPGAQVVSVRRQEVSTSDSLTQPVAKHPTAKQKSDGAKIVQQIQAAKGKSYVDQQRKLPDTIVVP